MRISAIIPCYNAGPWIVECLRSVAGQTYLVSEIIVIDDGSKDDSIAQIEGSGIPVKLIRTNHVNAAAARNIGAQAATGDWVALLDADDAWYEDHLQRAVDLLRGTNDVAYRSIFDVMDAQSRVEALQHEHKNLVTEPKSGLTDQDSIRLESQHFPFAHSTMVYRRDRFLEVGGFDVAQVKRHDIDLWLRITQGQTWSYDPKPGVKHRLSNPNRISANLVDCEYYYLRALLKNRPAYTGNEMESLVLNSARRAMSLALVDGSHEDFKKAREVSWNHLSPGFRAFYFFEPILAPVMRTALKVKRRLRALGNSTK